MKRDQLETHEEEEDGSSGSPGAVTAASVGPSKAAAEADRETRQPEINITEVSHEWSLPIVYIRISNV